MGLETAALNKQIQEKKEQREVERHRDYIAGVAANAKKINI